MKRILLSACALLCWGGASLSAADAPPVVKDGLDLIPANAAAGFAIHNLEELKSQGDTFLKNTELEKQLGLRPSQAFEFVFGFLGITRGRDDNAPAGIFIANLIEARVLNPNGNEVFDLLVVAVGVADPEAMAANFGLAKGELKPEQLTRVLQDTRQFGKYVYLRGKQLYLGNHERAVLSVAKGKPLSDALTVNQKARVARSDLLLHVGTTAWGIGWVDFVNRAKARAEKLKGQEADPETGLSAEIVQLLAASLPHVQTVLLSAAIDEQGLELTQLTTFRSEDQPAVQKLLAMLRGGEEASTLTALPGRNLIAAQAVRSDGSQNRALVRALLELALNLEPYLQEKKLLAVTERPNFVGLFDAVWQRLTGSHLAVYQNENPAKEGLFSIVAILETRDPKEFLQEMRQLARFANPGELKLDGEHRQADDVATVEKLIEQLGDPSFRVRESATLKLGLIGPPALPFLEKAAQSKDREVALRARRLRGRIEKTIEGRRRDVMSRTLLSRLQARWGDFPEAETRGGLPIDIVKMELEGESKALESQLKEAFGPEWSKVRLAVKDQKIVVLLGSHVELLEETLANLDKNNPGLVAHDALAEFHRRSSASRRAEFHVDLEHVVPLVKKLPAQGNPPAKAGLTSLSLAVESDLIELHLWIPNAEFRALSRFR